MELRSCYFCGSTGRTLATRDLVPRSRTPDADDPASTSVVLCPDCDGKLERIFDRVLASAPERPEDDVDHAPDAAAGGAGLSTGITFDDGDDGRDGTGVEPAATDGASGPDRGDGDAGPEGASDDDSARSAGVDVVGGTTAGDTTAGRTGEGSAGSEADDADGDEVEGDGVDGAAGDDTEGTDADDAGGGSSGELRSLGEGSTGTYRKALRLLQNREFPMARADLVDVLSSAYDLDHGECERLVDLAVERGWLVDDGGELRRG